MRKFPLDLTRADHYRYYNLRMEGKLDASLFGKISNDFWKKVLEELILKFQIVYLPSGMGQLYIQNRPISTELDENFKIKKTNAPIDWRATKELWARDEEAAREKRLVYYLNLHTNQLVYSLCWSRQNTKLKGLTPYMFKPARAVKRAMAKLFLE